MIKRLLAVLGLSALMVLAPMSMTIQASAGASKVLVATNESIKHESGLDRAKWRTRGNVDVHEGQIVFNEEIFSDIAKTARIIATDKIRATDSQESGLTSIFKAEYIFNIEDIPNNDGSRFAFVYGLKSVTSEFGTDGTTEIYFINVNGELKMGISRYEFWESDTTVHKVDIIPAATYDMLNFDTDLKLQVEETIDAKFLVKLGYADDTSADMVTICDKNTPNNNAHSTSGFTSIGQTDFCKAYVDSVEIEGYSYSNMETPEVFEENFDNGHYNANGLFSASVAGNLVGGATIVDGKFVHTNNSATMATKYQYSNFEMTIDIEDIKLEKEVDEYGNTVNSKCEWIAISLGAARATSYNNIVHSPVFLVLEPSGRAVLYEGNKVIEIKNIWTGDYDSLNLWKKVNADKVFTLKVKMTNGLFEVFIKEKDGEYPTEALYSYQYSFTVEGHVGISTYSGGYTFDNFKIVNTDYKPKAVEITYKENKLDSFYDYDYQDTWTDDELIGTDLQDFVKPEQTEGGCSSAVSTIAGLPLIIGGVCLFVGKQKMKKGENDNEKNK